MYFSEEKRENFDRYKYFYNIFVRQIVGKKEFDNSCCDWSEGDPESNIATISDEALALLCFENHLEVWKDVWEKSEGQIRPISKNEDYPQDWISTKTTKYTTKYDAKGMPIDTKDKTWTAAGIERFNTLFLEVKKNRKEFPDFLCKFIAWKQSSSKKSAGSVTSSKDNLPDANDDLFYDPDDLNLESLLLIQERRVELENKMIVLMKTVTILRKSLPVTVRKMRVKKKMKQKRKKRNKRERRQKGN